MAILVDADLGIRYEHQNVVQTVGASMAQRLLQQADCRVINPRQIASWQLQRGSGISLPLPKFLTSCFALDWW